MDDLPNEPGAWLRAIVSRYDEPDWEQILRTSIRRLSHTQCLALLRSCLRSAEPVERGVGAVGLAAIEREDNLSGDLSHTREWLDLLLDALSVRYTTAEHWGSPDERALIDAAVVLWRIGERAPDVLARAIAGREPSIRRRALASSCEMHTRSFGLVRTVYLEWQRLALGEWHGLAAPVLRAIQTHEGVRCYPWLLSLAQAGLGELSVAAGQVVADLDNDRIEVGPPDSDPANWIVG